MIDRINRAGRFTERIYIEEQVDITDTAGQSSFGPQASTGVWNLVYECWAHVEDTYGLEQKQSGRDVNEEWAVVQILWAPSLRDLILPDMRVRHKYMGTIYDIRSVLPHVDGQRKLIEMTCLLVR